MGQRLRVVAWLRFGNKAQLTKGLQGFAAHEAPGYFEADQWDVDGLDARVSIDAELPGDFTNVERPFMEIVRCAQRGYVDYFEEGNARIYGGGKGPLKRWACASVDRGFIMPEGTMPLPWPEGAQRMVLEGSLSFADAKAAGAVGAQLPVRLPFMQEDGAVRELRLGTDAWKVDGASLAVGVAIVGPAPALATAVVEAMMLVSAKAKGGALVLYTPFGTHTVKAGAKHAFEARRKTPEGALPEVAPVDAKEPVARAEAPAAAPAAPVAQKKKARAAAPSEDLPLAGDPRVAGARSVAGGVVVWGGRAITVFDAALAPVRTFALEGEDWSWTIKDVVALDEGRFAVVFDGWRTLGLLDARTGEKAIVRTEHSSVKEAHRFGDAIVSCGAFAGLVQVHRGADEIARFDAGHPIDKLAVLPDGTGVCVGHDGSSRWDLARAAKLADLGSRTDVHVFADGRWLLEKYGELEGGDGWDVRFSLDVGNSHTVGEVDAKTLFAFSSSGRSVHLVDRATGAQTALATGHKKDLGAFRRVDDGLWASHARSMPGLNERFGFDGTVRLFAQDGWAPAGVLDTKAPVRALVPLGRGRCALLFDDPIRGKEIALVRGAEVVGAVKAKKAIAGALAMDGDRLLWWSKDGAARVRAVG